MNTKLKQLTLLATAGFLLAACGQNNSAETTQAAQEATQANTKQSKLNPANNQQSQEKAADNQQTKEKATNKHQNKKKSNAQNSSNLPKDGETVYKLEDNGNTTTIKYYFKDDIVYLQDAVYAFSPKKWVKPKRKYKNFSKRDTPSTTALKELNPLLHEKMEFTTTHSKLITTISTGKSFINALLKHSPMRIQLL